MRSFGLVWLACGACSFSHGKIDQGLIDASTIDAPDGRPLDGPPDGLPDARTCFGTFVNICLAAVPPPDYTVAAFTRLNTDVDCTQVVVLNNLPDLCVVAAVNININAQLAASGSRPLVLLATNSIDVGVGGMIDVSSFRPSAGVEIIGAGEETGMPLCGSPTPGGDHALVTPPTTGAGGGVGGSFGGAGGAGGAGVSGAGGTGGVAAAATGTPTFVRGGCRGTAGGVGGGNLGGIPGKAGGAVHMIAGTSITNLGTIRAAGMGGYGGAALSGGSGAGSGGFIGFDAPVITNTGTLNANGGGGGEGGGQTTPGNLGQSAIVDVTMRPFGGGTFNDNPNGGNGGRGTQGAVLDGESGFVGNNGGGGGGGGAGVIRVFPAQTLAGTVSPPAT